MDMRIENSTDPKDREPDLTEQGPFEIKQINVEETGPEEICRICLSPYEPNSNNPLITPCICKGSSQYAHFECLKKWLNFKMMEKKSNILTTY